MSDTDPKCVGDLWCLVGDGETRTFGHTRERDGAEPHYYRVATAGEYQALPRWIDALPIETRPRPAMCNLAQIPLGEARYHFSIDADHDQLADLYYVTPGVFLVSGLLLRMLEDHDVGPVDRSVAQLGLRGGVIADNFHVIIPTPVLDVVDIAKSDVKITRDEIVPGSKKFATQIHFPAGLVFRDPAPLAFLGRYDVNWWWRESLVRAAVQAGVRGLRAVHSHNTDYRAEIRTK